MKLSPVLQHRAYMEAAAIVENAMDDIDLPDDLSEDEEEAMREFIRTHVSGYLRKKGVSYK